MSAAAPLPPPEPSAAHTMNTNGYTHGSHSKGADGRGSSDGAGGSPRPGGSYPPIAEIVASASETVEALKSHSVRPD
jgi:ubiquitin carboxyl-terminal hydrolase 8